LRAAREEAASNGGASAGAEVGDEGARTTAFHARLVDVGEPALGELVLVLFLMSVIQDAMGTDMR